MIHFDPQPAADELPSVFPSPFSPGQPHPVVARAAAQTRRVLAELPAELRAAFEGPLGGKMIGVLAVRDRAGQIGYLQGFAGMLEGRARVDGFVPPLYAVELFDELWRVGGAEITALDSERAALRERRDLSPGLTPAESAKLEALGEAQRDCSRSLHAALHDTYQIPNARGETRPLRALFEPRQPPGGAGDCAGPKLLARAYALGLQPLAMAEFWWGRPPPGGGRQHGVYYPACRGRCAVVLPFMLDGIPCEPAPDVGMRPIPASEPRTVHEDETLLIVDKPCGLLSVPGRGPRRRDSVEHRLQQRGAAGLDWPRLVHRLDLATSGLLIAAKDRETYVGLQRLFSSRQIDKRYVALIAGELDGDAGTVELALRRDIDDRPRQIHDAARGKPARTRWEVLARTPGHTRVALYPHTGRTHQLRLHAAHALGLGAPIVGDLLYGFGGERLMLHAERLSFVHPATGQPLTVSCPCPF